MAAILVSLLSGMVFATGLVLSGMINPAKVQGFLDVAGHWDPSLAFVMGGGLAIMAVAVQLARKRERPLLTARFAWPTAKDIDLPLIGGAALFGIGWGLVGWCPGPVIAALGTGAWQAFLFVASMIAGTMLVRRLRAR